MISKYSATEIYPGQFGLQFCYFIYFETIAHRVTPVILELSMQI